MASLTLPPHHRTKAQSPAPPIFRCPVVPEAPKESAVVRLLITPLTFVSFLISLFLIDSHNSSLRLHQHSSPYRPPNTVYGRSKAFLRNLIFKPQPYTYIRSPYREPDPAWEREKKRDEEPWHWHTKQRKMMKMEVSDAFKVRQWVLAGIMIGMGGVGWMVLCLGTWVWHRWI